MVKCISVQRKLLALYTAQAVRVVFQINVMREENYITVSACCIHHKNSYRESFSDNV